MHWWYYNKQELRNTPSFRVGMEFEDECQARREGARFIIETGSKMDLGYNTMATGVVYFHRFYMVHSFTSFPKYLTACCALFLAGKVEETPKKARDIIKMAEKCLSPTEFGTFGDDPKEELLVLERILLQSIKFDLQVDHPYAFLLKYAKSLEGDQQNMQDVLQMAWTFVNDSLCTTLCLQWEPEVIAVAMLYLAAKLKKYDINNWFGKKIHQTRWWDMFVNGVTLDLLEDICHQVLDLYSQKRPAVSNSNLVNNSNTNTNAQNSHSQNNVTSNNQLKAPPLQKQLNHPPPQPAITEKLPPMSTPPIPKIANPIPNINSMGNIYGPPPPVTAPPPTFSIPPPGMPMVPNPHEHQIFPPHLQHAHPPPQAPPYNAITSHYGGSNNQYGSYPTYQ